MRRRRENVRGLKKQRLKKFAIALHGGRGSHVISRECTCRSKGLAVRHVTKGTRSGANALRRVTGRTLVRRHWIPGADAPSRLRLSRTFSPAFRGNWFGFCMANQAGPLPPTSELRAFYGKARCAEPSASLTIFRLKV